MKKLVVASLFAFGCAASPAANQDRLVAGADAQHVGVYAYSAVNDTVTLYDRYGMELGQVTVTAPSSEGRHFELAAVDGTTDEVDVVRPMKDGRFLAPITPETMLTTALADEALASHWAAHQVAFKVNLDLRLAAQGLLPSDGATTASCSTYSCGQSCTPLGCAKPGNTSLGCTNPSQLAATKVDNMVANFPPGPTYTTYNDCIAAGPAKCVQYYGGTSSDWTNPMGTLICVPYGGSFWQIDCRTGTSTNSWVASCPPSTCTAPNYDAVPRNGSCLSPGSCSYSQGAVTCTTYH